MVLAPGAWRNKPHQLLVGEASFRQGEQMGIFHGAKNGLQLFEHGCWIESALGQKILRRDFRLVDAHNILHAQLHLALVKRRLAAHPDKIILVEAAPEIVGALPYPRFDLAALVDQLKRQITVAGLGHPMGFRRDQKHRIDQLIVANIGGKERFHLNTLPG